MKDQKSVLAPDEPEIDEFSSEEISRRMERGLRRALSTPAQPHGSPVDKSSKPKRIKSKSPHP